MPRKLFELDLPSSVLGAITHQALLVASEQKVCDINPLFASLDQYWNREHAAYLLRTSHGIEPYFAHLPGRLHTYRCLANWVHELNQHNSAISWEVGCGSAMGSILLAELGWTALGTDASCGAVAYARRLASSFGVSVDVSHGDYRDIVPSKSADVVWSLGLLEHFDLDEQEHYVRALRQLTDKWVVLSIPNKLSPLYLAMSEMERDRVSCHPLFPQEDFIYDVDFERLARDAGLEMCKFDGIHIVPPRIIPAHCLDSDSESFFREVIAKVLKLTAISVPKAWAKVEMEIPEELRRRYAWFHVVALRRRGVSDRWVPSGSLWNR